MCDLFHDAIPDEFIDRVFAVMALCPQQHTFQVLTKRPERMREYLSGHQSTIPYLGRMPLERVHIDAAGHVIGDGGVMDRLKRAGNVYALYLDRPWPLPNVWLGTSIEDQPTANARIPYLLASPAAVRWVSCEPMLGAVDLTQSLYRGEAGITMCGYLRDMAEPDDFHFHARKIDWVVVGGESGPHDRPCNVEWVRDLLRQTKSAGVPTFIKQLGVRCVMDRNDAVQPVALGAGWRALELGSDLGEVSFRQHKGADMAEWPEDVRVQEMPS